MGQNTWAEFSPKGGADYLGGQITWAAAKSGAEYLFARIPICSYSGAQPQKPVLGVFLRAAWPGMTNGRGKGRRGPGKGGKEIVGSSSQIGPPQGTYLCSSK